MGVQSMKLTLTPVSGNVDGECPTIELASLLACCLGLQAVLHPATKVHSLPCPGGHGHPGCSSQPGALEQPH